jgi:outer membrane protein insertion porin family
MSFNIFDPTKAQVSFDRAKSPLAGENDIDIIFYLKEKNRFGLQSTTSVGHNDATVSMSARAENLFGGAERIEGSFEKGTRTRNAWQILFQSPIAARSDILGEIGIFGLTRDHKFFASHDLVQRGAHLKLTVNTPSSLFFKL